MFCTVLRPLLILFVIFLLLSDSSKKFEYNSLDRKSYRKIGSRKNNKNPPSLIVVDTDETHHNTSIFKRDKHKKRQVGSWFLEWDAMRVVDRTRYSSGTRVSHL